MTLVEGQSLITEKIRTNKPFPLLLMQGRGFFFTSPFLVLMFDTLLFFTPTGARSRMYPAVRSLPTERLQTTIEKQNSCLLGRCDPLSEQEVYNKDRKSETSIIIKIVGVILRNTSNSWYNSINGTYPLLRRCFNIACPLLH